MERHISTAVTSRYDRDHSLDCSLGLNEHVTRPSGCSNRTFLNAKLVEDGPLNRPYVTQEIRIITVKRLEGSRFQLMSMMINSRGGNTITLILSSSRPEHYLILSND